jgi:dTDP-4-dehydrorhamnose reductase
VTLLVVGGSGLLGGEVIRRALAAGERVAGTYRSAPYRSVAGPGGAGPGGVSSGGAAWHRLDVRDAAAVRGLVARVRPRAVVNCAYAYADWRVTADGAAAVASAVAAAGARLVHVSSDAVHGGRPDPYADDEPPSPVFPYGAAKAAAETAVRVLDPAAALVRTSLILGDESSSQIRLCLDALAGRGALFTDEVRCPVDVGDLARVVLALAAGDHAGPLNVGGADALSRADLGLLVARRYGVDPAAMRTTTIAGAGLVRPREVRLDSTRVAGLLGVRLRGARELLA